MASITSCTEHDDELSAAYGYVQFKLYKNDTAPAQAAATRANNLDFLHEAHKVKVIMQREGSTIEQTLVLNAYNNENAAYGLRSDKLQLLVGEYKVIGYTLFDKLDKELLSASAPSQFTVVADGLVTHNLSVEVTPRGKASFRLVKPESFSATRSEETGAYPFSNIKAVSLTLKNKNTLENVEINKVIAILEEGFHDYAIDDSEYNAQTTYFTVDTVVWLKAGTYTVSSYITYSDKKARTVLEAVEVTNGAEFVVTDNTLTENVPVTIQLSETAEHIKDYLALKEIWLALDGPNWSYYGEAEAPGCNWDFNKDLDMWGEQPGVSIDGDGRVVSLSLAGMGARGVVPDAIGQLTEISVLSLGTHDELLGGHLFDEVDGAMTDEQRQAIRMSYHDKYLKRDIREGLSDILQDAINRDEKQRPIVKSSRITLKDVQFGKQTNAITGISRAMMRLTKLQQFYIANSPITADNFFVDVDTTSAYYEEQSTWSWASMESLTDVEIYNCRNLDRLPLELLTTLPELQSLNIACNNHISGAQLKSDWEAIIDGASGPRLQLLYMGYNNLEEFPQYEHLSKMVKLALLDCTNNKVKTLHPFGKNVNLTKVYLDYNEIEHIPGHREDDGYDYFFGYYDVELFSCTNNKLTQVPDIFNAKSVNIMKDVDLSYNLISGFEHGDAHRGINANSVSLSYNQLEEMPAVLFKTGSPMTILMLSGNGMKRIPEGSMIGKCSHYLQSLDLSYNKLTDLPSDFWATNLPYLYGIDLSYNSFSEFPYEPLDCSYLTTFGIRHQRDEQGNRTLRTWPTGLYTCPSLVGFYIGSNDLRKIEDTISPYIRYFEIKDNPNISIDLSDVCDYIAAGYYLLIYDKTQDIRGCAYLDLE
ncbi:MAG: DUF4458 domain-containing protein [Bacteroidaceae bacterium]|nr:DUF4458 domain-containing protein [Bacteroidaceae bacterium]